MDETYNIKAIILKNEPFREADCRLTIFSLEKGKMELVARGAKKIKSKAAGHIQPLTVSSIMVVRGRNYDYAGSVAAENCFINIKSDLEKIKAAGQAADIFEKFVKGGEKDEKLFYLLFGYLILIDANKPPGDDYELWKNYFIIKLLDLLGYRPELFKCLECGEKIKPNGNAFSFKKGGIICASCKKIDPLLFHFAKKNTSLTISENCVKVLRLIIEKDFLILVKLKVNKGLAEEVKRIVSSFLNYHHDIIRRR
jgi:DNA repair protein RecO (recombination protein O)